MAKTTKIYNKYTEEFRASAVTLAKQTSARAAAEQLSIPLGTLMNWARKQKKPEAPEVPDPFMARAQAKLAELNEQRNTLEQAIRLLS